MIVAGIPTVHGGTVWEIGFRQKKFPKQTARSDGLCCEKWNGNRIVVGTGSDWNHLRKSVYGSVRLVFSRDMGFRLRIKAVINSIFVIRRSENILTADALINKYGLGYLKTDYNIEPGATDFCSDSVGNGLLQHNRAYLAWLENLLSRHPSLTIENCSSGGMRMDYAMLSRCSVQSTSNMEDYVMYSTIAANVPAVLTPEQAAVWCYPGINCKKKKQPLIW